MKFEQKRLAIRLREEGKSYAEIIREVAVSRGTLSKWLKDVPLTDNQLISLKGRMKSRYAGAKANQLKAAQRKLMIMRSAKDEVSLLVKNPLFVAGISLYWAEGTKDGNTVAFTNSDPEMIRLMMKWFRDICRVPEEKFRILVFIHSLHVNANWQDKWVSVTGVPRSQFMRPYVKPTITKHRKNKLYEGTCVIRINSSDLLARIRGWRQGLSELL